MKLIVNADDFGLSSTVNDAIVRAFEMGIIERATAIANAPFFAEACQLARDHDFHNRIGIHFNITEGLPISAQMVQVPLFCSPGGRLIFQRNTRTFFSTREMNAILAECECQIIRFHKHGLHPTHLDSHHHVHTEWSVFRTIEPLLRKHGFSSVRVSRNIGTCSVPKKAYKKIFNSYLKRSGWTSAEYFGDYTDLLNCGTSKLPDNSVVEVMVHPTSNSNGVLIDAISEQELAPKIDELRQMSHCSGLSPC